MDHLVEKFTEAQIHRGKIHVGSRVNVFKTCKLLKLLQKHASFSSSCKSMQVTQCSCHHWCHVWLSSPILVLMTPSEASLSGMNHFVVPESHEMRASPLDGHHIEFLIISFRAAISENFILSSRPDSEHFYPSHISP